MTVDVSASRVVRGSTATISFQGVDQFGEPADPGVVTVGVVDSFGDLVVAAGSATTGTGAAPRVFTLTPLQTSQLDVVTASWSSGGAVIGTTRHEIVGGVYVSVAGLRATEPALAEVAEYPSAKLVEARDQVEAMFEDACGRAFVPRFRVDVLSGNGRKSIDLYRPDVRRVRWVRVNGEPLTDPVRVSGRSVVLEAGVWPSGALNIEVGYEYGLDRPPADLRLAAVQAVRSQVNTFRSGIPDRAMSFQPVDGGNVVLATPGLGPWITGIPSVDEAIKRYRDDSVRVA